MCRQNSQVDEKENISNMVRCSTLSHMNVADPSDVLWLMPRVLSNTVTTRTFLTLKKVVPNATSIPDAGATLYTPSGANEAVIYVSACLEVKPHHTGSVESLTEVHSVDSTMLFRAVLRNAGTLLQFYSRGRSCERPRARTSPHGSSSRTGYGRLASTS